MLLLITISFLLKRYGTQAIPLPTPTPTSTSFEAPIFARDNSSDGCHSRTVLDILWSCLATTFACTWVSVHPNVPFKGDGKWTLLRRRIFLMFFSILAPEFMIMWAFKQWRGAVMIKEVINKAIVEASTDKHKPIPELWTTTHGHFLQMGGFRLNATARENFFWGGSTGLGQRSECPLRVNDDDPRFAYISGIHKELDDAKVLPRHEERKVIQSLRRTLIPVQFHYRHETSEGSWNTDFSSHDKSAEDVWEGVLTIESLKRLLSENLVQLPTITEDEINDKSKGDAFSKGIALLQLTWFIVQIITRAVQGIAITELELTTAALAGLSSVMYIFWWCKPRDVRFPVVIRTKGVEELLAKRSKNVEWSIPYREFDIREHLSASIAIWIKALFVAPAFLMVSFPFQVISIFLKFAKSVKTSPHRVTLLFSQLISLLPRTRRPAMGDNEGELLLAADDRPRHNYKSQIKIYFLTLVQGAKTATKSALVPLFRLLYIIDVVIFIPIAKIVKSDDGTSISGRFCDVNTEDEIFSMMFYSENYNSRSLFSTASLAGALFGAVHCLAWQFDFPSHAEQILWRTASSGIVGSCAVTFQTVLCDKFARGDTDGFWEIVERLWVVISLLLSGLASFIYPVSRITLLLLAITSLRSLPPSAFDTVDWVGFVPHI